MQLHTELDIIADDAYAVPASRSPWAMHRDDVPMRAGLTRHMAMLCGKRWSEAI
ncbi:MAG: hypothetical protein WBC93_06515 [Sulfitobacter sp.]